MIDCNNCPARNNCGIAVEYGSFTCMVKRMQSGATKADVDTTHDKHVNIYKKRCPVCGREGPE